MLRYQAACALPVPVALDRGSIASNWWARHFAVCLSFGTQHSLWWRHLYLNKLGSPDYIVCSVLDERGTLAPPTTLYVTISFAYFVLVQEKEMMKWKDGAKRSLLAVAAGSGGEYLPSTGSVSTFEVVRPASNGMFKAVLAVFRATLAGDEVRSCTERCAGCLTPS